MQGMRLQQSGDMVGIVTFLILQKPTQTQALSWSDSVPLLMITDVKATPTDLTFSTHSGDEYSMSFESLATEWKNAIENNVSILKQIMTGKSPSLPTVAASMMMTSGALHTKASPTSPPGEVPEY
jgi:hypothetical protein